MRLIVIFSWVSLKFKKIINKKIRYASLDHCLYDNQVLCGLKKPTMLLLRTFVPF